MTTQDVTRNIWRNSISNYVSMAIRMAVGLLMFRMLYQGLSREEFGFWALLWSVFGYGILLDFGLAKGNPTDAGNQTASKSIFGYSRNYASLEQIQGTGTDPRSDLYSLAATLYHLLTNRPPEDALTRAMAVLGHQPDPLVPANMLLPEIPAGVAGVLQKALALNAGQRPATAAEMRTMLREHEKYSDLAAGTFEPEPLQTEIFSQRTKVLPASTVHHSERQTDI